MKMHPNLRSYENRARNHSQISRRVTLDRCLINIIAPLFSAEGWEALLDKAELDADLLWEPKFLARPEIVERAEKSRAVGA
jgi:hypothetical protein